MKEQLKKILGDFPVWHATLNDSWLPEAVDRLADYLIANDVIAPPLKVGDIVFAKECSWRNDSKIVPYKITNICITKNRKGIWNKKYRAMMVRDGKTVDWQLNFAFDDIDKTVFPSINEVKREVQE